MNTVQAATAERPSYYQRAVQYGRGTWSWFKGKGETVAKVQQSILGRTIKASLLEGAGAEIDRRVVNQIPLNLPEQVGSAAYFSSLGCGIPCIYHLSISKAKKAALLILLHIAARATEELAKELGPSLETVRDMAGGIGGGYAGLRLAGCEPQLFVRGVPSEGYGPSMLRLLIVRLLFDKIVAYPSSSFPWFFLNLPRTVACQIAQLSAYCSYLIGPQIRKIVSGKMTRGPLLTSVVNVAVERFCFEKLPQIVGETNARLNPFHSLFSEEVNRYIETNFISPLTEGIQKEAIHKTPLIFSALVLSFNRFAELCQSPDVSHLLKQCGEAFRHKKEKEIKSSLNALGRRLKEVVADNVSPQGMAQGAAKKVLRAVRKKIATALLQEMEKGERLLVGVSLMQDPEKKFLKRALPILLTHFGTLFLDRWKGLREPMTKAGEEAFVDYLHDCVFSIYLQLVLPSSSSSAVSGITKRGLRALLNVGHWIESFAVGLEGRQKPLKVDLEILERSPSNQELRDAIEIPKDCELIEEGEADSEPEIVAVSEEEAEVVVVSDDDFEEVSGGEGKEL